MSSNGKIKNCAPCMHTIAVAAVKHSCESILESFVIEYKNHFDDRRNVDETTANEKFTIVMNGQLLFRPWTCTVKEILTLLQVHPLWRNSSTLVVPHLH